MKSTYQSRLSRLFWGKRRHDSDSHTFRPRIEPLEARHLLTTLVVDTTLDDPAADATLEDGFVSLREAVRAANENTPFGDAPAGQSDAVDRVVFSPALAGMTIELQGTELTIADDLVLEGLAQDQLTVSGNGTSRIFFIAEDANVAISDVALVDGDSEYGGAVANFGTLTIQDSVLNANASPIGGALLNVGSMQVISSTVANNRAEYEGGGIFNLGTLTLSDSTIEFNEAATSGGGIYNRYAALTIRESRLAGNSAESNGGAIFSEHGTLHVALSFINNNSAFQGGGIYDIASSVTVEDSTFQANTASLGGGVAVRSSADWTILRSTFSENSAENTGGAIDSLLSMVDITNGTLSGNQSGRAGGAIWNFGALQITHGTVTGNRADVQGDDTSEGGGLWSLNYEPVVTNTIIAGNWRGAPGNDTADDVHATLDPASFHNLIGDAASAGGLIGGVNGNIVGSGGNGTIDVTSVLDPQLADNGGATLTHALVAGSPAIDAAISLLPYDQRGWWRMVDGNGDGVAASDIGAYERVTLSGLLVTLGDQIESLGTEGTLTRGEATRLSKFLELAQREVARDRSSKATHFFDLFDDHVARLVERGRLSPMTPNLISDAARSISDPLLQGHNEQQALDELFAEFEFGWGILD